MPNLRAINVEMISQHRIRSISEFCLPSDTSSTAVTETVYLTSYPSMRFWIQYSVSQPIPWDQIYFFKLFINGRNASSWGTTEDQSWSGGAMFNIDHIESKYTGYPGVCSEWAKAFFSINVQDSDAWVIVKVFRSGSRKAISPPNISPEGNGISNGEMEACQSSQDFLDQGHPRTYYQYKLQDPIDRPFATFRFRILSLERSRRVDLQINNSLDPPAESIPEDDDTRRECPPVTYSPAQLIDTQKHLPTRIKFVDESPDLGRQFTHARKATSRFENASSESRNGVGTILSNRQQITSLASAGVEKGQNESSLGLRVSPLGEVPFTKVRRFSWGIFGRSPSRRGKAMKRAFCPSSNGKQSLREVDGIEVCVADDFLKREAFIKSRRAFDSVGSAHSTSSSTTIETTAS